MTAPALDVSVIVCTRNRNAELLQCLSSLRALDPAGREIIVVNSAGDAEANDIATRFNARSLSTERPGVSHARNIGVAAAKFPLLAFIDDDAVPEKDWLLHLSAPFTNPHVGATSGAVRPLGDCGEWGQRYFASAFNGHREPRLDRNTPGWFWLVNTGHAGIGANMMFRKDALDSEHPFDTRLGRGAPIPGNEEHFAFFHAVEKGFSCFQAPDAVVFHPSLSTREEVRNFELQMARIAGGYLALLLAEYPAHRIEILGRIVRRLGGQRGEPRNAAQGSLISRRERLPGMLRGIRIYRRLMAQRPT
jgi:glycosyltransferase involved in cell wall biosynthesis